MESESDLIQWIHSHINYFYSPNYGYDPYYMENAVSGLQELLEEYEENCDISIPKWDGLIEQICNDFLLFSDITESFRKNRVKKLKYIIRKSISKFCDIPTHEQRTPEWYEFRKKNFTASDFYKIMSDKQLLSVIKKKFKPHTSMSYTPWSLKKGILFEDVAIKIYENKYNSKVNDFGCLPHPEINGLAASPDGIVIEPSSERYGNMLEIKCVLSRKLNGLIPKEYWIQMQIQMEVCNLFFCDFLECQFYEKPTKQELEDLIQERKENNLEPNIEYYGILIEGADNTSVIGELNTLEKPEYPEGFIPTDIHYWYLDHMVMRTIRRNKDWFESVKPRLFYAIEKLRSYNPENEQTICVNTKPKKKKSQNVQPSQMNICMMLDE